MDILNLTSSLTIGNLPLQLRFNKDKTLAVLQWKKGFKSDLYPDLNFDTIMEALESHGLCDIDRPAVRQWLSEVEKGEAVVIAQGVSARDGEDGRVAYTFESNVAEQVWRNDDSLKIDFRVRNEINNVCENELLGRLIAPIEGEAGRDVCGEPIEPVSGQPARLVAGKNVCLSEDGQCAYATSDGCVKVVRSRISVDTKTHIRGNVDFRSGSIEFNGDVYIGGDVKETFSVTAGGSITVGGLVDRAQLKAGGDIIIHNGVFGKEGVSVEAEGNISFRFAENANLRAGGSIYAKGALVNCQAHASDKIWLSAGEKAVIGGHIYAAHGIEAHSLGNARLPTRTIVEFGANPNVEERERSFQIRSRVASEERKREMEDELIALREESYQQRNAQVIARGTIYPGVVLISGSARYEIKDALHGVTIYRAKNGREILVKNGAPPMRLGGQF